MQPTYMQMAAILEPLVDLFLCETLSSTAETMAAASAASMSGWPPVLTPGFIYLQYAIQGGSLCIGNVSEANWCVVCLASVHCCACSGQWGHSTQSSGVHAASHEVTVQPDAAATR